MLFCPLGVPSLTCYWCAIKNKTGPGKRNKHTPKRNEMSGNEVNRNEVSRNEMNRNEVSRNEVRGRDEMKRNEGNPRPKKQLRVYGSENSKRFAL